MCVCVRARVSRGNALHFIQINALDAFSVIAENLDGIEPHRCGRFESRAAIRRQYGGTAVPVLVAILDILRRYVAERKKDSGAKVRSCLVVSRNLAVSAARHVISKFTSTVAWRPHVLINN